MKFSVTEHYMGTRIVEVEAPTAEEAIDIVRQGEGEEVHHESEPIAPYEAEEIK